MARKHHPDVFGSYQPIRTGMSNCYPGGSPVLKRTPTMRQEGRKGNTLAPHLCMSVLTDACQAPTPHIHYADRRAPPCTVANVCFSKEHAKASAEVS